MNQKLSLISILLQNFGHLLEDLDARNQKLLFWNFSQSVTEICTGDNKKLIEYFKSGEFDLVIQGKINNI